MPGLGSGGRTRMQGFPKLPVEPLTGDCEPERSSRHPSPPTAPTERAMWLLGSVRPQPSTQDPGRPAAFGTHSDSGLLSGSSIEQDVLSRGSPLVETGSFDFFLNHPL